MATRLSTGLSMFVAAAAFAAACQSSSVGGGLGRLGPRRGRIDFYGRRLWVGRRGRGGRSCPGVVDRDRRGNEQRRDNGGSGGWARRQRQRAAHPRRRGTPASGGTPGSGGSAGAGGGERARGSRRPRSSGGGEAPEACPAPRRRRPAAPHRIDATGVTFTSEPRSGEGAGVQGGHHPDCEHDRLLHPGQDVSLGQRDLANAELLRD